MYTLADYIGEDKVDLALHNFLMRYRYANAANQVDAVDSTAGSAAEDQPYPDTRLLIEELRAQTPADLQYLIDDGFNRSPITSISGCSRERRTKKRQFICTERRLLRAAKPSIWWSMSGRRAPASIPTTS